MRGGGSSLFVYPKGRVITFLVSTKGGGVMCFSEEFCWYLPAPLPLEIMNGPLSRKLSMQLAYSELL